jgi:beta-lactamase class A
MLKVVATGVCVAALVAVLGFGVGRRAAAAHPASSAAAGTGTTILRGERPDPLPTPTPPPAPAPKPHPSFGPLQDQVDALVRASGASASVTLVELGGVDPQAWSVAGDDAFVAASTYKLPLLMAEAQGLAAGAERGSDGLCYEDEDWEDGPYGDYVDGDCFTRSELMRRVGQDSDNTAAHILVRYLGGVEALNDYASAHGARESGFYDPNLTTSNDLARLLVDAASGRAGGTAAQLVLYPLLTQTAYEDGIPAGVPSGATVVHKVGYLDAEVNDAGLVLNGPDGAYVLAVCTDGLGGDEAWQLVADISRVIWQYESGR